MWAIYETRLLKGNNVCKETATMQDLTIRRRNIASFKEVSLEMKQDYWKKQYNYENCENTKYDKEYKEYCKLWKSESKSKKITKNKLVKIFKTATTNKENKQYSIL